MNVFEQWPAKPYDNSHDKMRTGNWLQTFSGRQFYPLDPRASEVYLEDIAQALSKLCRFNGHCKFFYSVAEHSCYVADELPPELALQGLLHDATEAYCGDVIRPLKPALSNYSQIEFRIWEAIAERFNLPRFMADAVHDADNAVLLAEQEQIMAVPPAAWKIKGKAADRIIVGYTPTDAYRLFLMKFKKITGQLTDGHY